MDPALPAKKLANERFEPSVVNTVCPNARGVVYEHVCFCLASLLEEIAHR